MSRQKLLEFAAFVEDLLWTCISHQLQVTRPTYPRPKLEPVFESWEEKRKATCFQSVEVEQKRETLRWLKVEPKKEENKTPQTKRVESGFAKRLIPATPHHESSDVIAQKRDLRSVENTENTHIVAAPLPFPDTFETAINPNKGHHKSSQHYSWALNGGKR